MPLFQRFWKRHESHVDDESNETVVDDPSAEHLSYVGTAVYDTLRERHSSHHHELWNVTSANVVGLHLTPQDAFTRTDRVDPAEGHDDWFPDAIGDLIGQTERWCDVLTLAPPDGKFMKAFQRGLQTIVQRAEQDDMFLERITIRILFGNILGMPVDCNKIIEELTQGIEHSARGSRIKLWVGSWRKDVSWNHAKIIAIDGQYLWTGGHNFWDAHYLQTDPVQDLSVVLHGGGAARDAHRFANAQWGYICKKQSTAWGRFVDQRIPDSLDVPRRARVTVSDYPDRTAEFPPYYRDSKLHLLQQRMRRPDRVVVPIITMGRYGALLKKARPSDDAFVAMILAAKRVIRFVLQDLGPVTIPGTKRALPGLEWPDSYMNAMAKVMWTKGVDIEIVLSNPGSIPGECSPTEACYGNGWSCVDVAAEIIKRIQIQFPDAHDGNLRHTVQDNLRVCYLRSPRGGRYYNDGKTLGLHSKHFIVDDICCYIGSQNLYLCDLAEWGVVIDDRDQVLKIKGEYWDPMWKTCYMVDDCDVQEVMDGLDIDRTAPEPSFTATTTNLTMEQIARIKGKLRLTSSLPKTWKKETSDGSSSGSDESEAED